MALVSTFELTLKPQLLPVSKLTHLNRKVIQGYFLTIANVNFFPVTVSLVFTLKFPSDSTTPPAGLTSWQDCLEVIDISGQNLFSDGFPQITLVPEIVPQTNKAQITFTIPGNGTSLLLLRPNILSYTNLLESTSFEACGYVELFLPSLADSHTATLLLTAEQRGTFLDDTEGRVPEEVNLDQITYALPVENGGVFKFSKCFC